MGGSNFALPKFCNFKDGFSMGSRKLSPQDLENIKQLAKSWGKIVVRRAFGEEGPGLDVDLAQMEDVAVAAAQGLTAGALEEATAQQARQLGAEQACPQCGKLCGVTEDERDVQVRGGSFQHCEPVCYCPACRRSFFPSTSAPEAGHARL